jgi:hypothetical protein
MITDREIVRTVFLPFVLAGVIAAVAVWRRWQWLLPLAAGAAFLAGYVAVNRPNAPSLPPADGSDWVMWVGAAGAVVGAAAGAVRQRWLAPVLASVAGVGVYVILKPLPAPAVSVGSLWMTALLIGAAAIALTTALAWTAPRVPAAWTSGAFSVSIAGAAVLVMSSHFRTMGVNGLAAASSLGAVALAALWIRDCDASSTRGVAAYAFAVLAGILVAGRFYPDQGVRWMQLILLLLSPALVLVGALLPVRRDWVKGVVAVAAVAILVAAVTVPPALRAKKSAENPDPADPYAGYSQ